MKIVQSIAQLQLISIRLHLLSFFIVLTLVIATPAYSHALINRDLLTPTKVKLEVRGIETDAQRIIMKMAGDYLEKAINHPDFKKRLMALEFKSRRFRKYNGDVEIIKNNEDIFRIIQTGVERQNSEGIPKSDNEIDLTVILVTKKRPTVGSTILGRNPVRTGYWFVNAAALKSDAVSVARHLMHEWLHVAGFYHYPNNSARDDVPYKIGSLVRDLLQENQSLREAASVDSWFFNTDLAKKMKEQSATLGEDNLVALLLDEAEDETDEDYR